MGVYSKNALIREWGSLEGTLKALRYQESIVITCFFFIVLKLHRKFITLIVQNKIENIEWIMKYEIIQYRTSPEFRSTYFRMIQGNQRRWYKAEIAFWNYMSDKSE